MWSTFDLAGMTCHVRDGGTPADVKMVYIWPMFPHRGNELATLDEYLQAELPAADYGIAAFQVKDWNGDLSPWPAPAAMGDQDFAGEGRKTLAWLSEHYTPWIREHFPACSEIYLMGYSLAGLFALWSLYETDQYQGVICCSGSLWLDAWDTYMQQHTLQQPARAYLSLGGKEEKTPNPYMSRVGDRTRTQEKIMKKDPKVTDIVLEWNSGGHFADSAKRLLKGILWMHK